MEGSDGGAAKHRQQLLRHLAKFDSEVYDSEMVGKRSLDMEAAALLVQRLNSERKEREN